MKNKVDLLKIAKIGSILLTGISGVIAAVVSTKENERTLQRLVDERLQK